MQIQRKEQNMSKYKAGNKFIIEIEKSVKDNLYRIKGMQGLVLDNEALEKLQYFSDKKDCGQCFPCNAGDTIYFVDDICKMIDECKVTKLESRYVNEKIIMAIEMTGDFWHCITADLFGVVAFYKKGEAEHALAKMRGVIDE